MIRFKPNTLEYAGNEREFLARQRRRTEYKKCQAEAKGADAKQLAVDMVNLDTYLHRTRSVHPQVREWAKVATLAGRVERGARKLAAEQRLRQMERQLVKDGLATKVGRTFIGGVPQGGRS